MLKLMLKLMFELMFKRMMKLVLKVVMKLMMKLMLKLMIKLMMKLMLKLMLKLVCWSHVCQINYFRFAAWAEQMNADPQCNESTQNNTRTPPTGMAFRPLASAGVSDSTGRGRLDTPQRQGTPRRFHRETAGTAHVGTAHY